MTAPAPPRIAARGAGDSGAPAAPAPPALPRGTPRWAARRASVRRRWSSWLGLVVLVALLLGALAAPWVSPAAPDAVDLAQKLQGPTWQHPAGTDQLGRDQLSRLLYGGRTALTVGVVSVVATMALALLAGGLAGYFGGTLDLLISALLNVLLTVPGLILTLAILGVLGTGPASLLLALIGAGWAGQARIVRGAVFEAREQGYVEAARVGGGRELYLLVRHILPNIMGTIVVLATLDLAGVLLTVTSLSFLGIGVQPPQADWGTMLSDSRPFAGTSPHLMVLPGACIVLFAVAANLAGDAIRDLLDPRAR